jgi:hypothetical protein
LVSFFFSPLFFSSLELEEDEVLELRDLLTGVSAVLTLVLLGCSEELE